MKDSMIQLTLYTFIYGGH